ncbi:hypothetical protein [Parasitella parasitica]|uniref:Uncharacterized protein n=1 Tax=Parasitella parasitica TaxID=35722 RepID=A0A0B7NTV3_9FUNG|nr:hypothetical protein [Parasitella parasitica]
MFDILLKTFSPFTTIYNSLVVVHCAFQQFEVKEHCYDPIQTDQVVANYNYNPFGGKDDGDLVMNDIEEDFMAVSKLMEDVDDEYCLAHFVEVAAIADVDADSSAPAQLPGCLRIFVANVMESITCSFIFGAILSCDFVLTEKRSIQGFVHVKSKEIKIARGAISASSQPKMRGFGVDFGVPGLKSVNFATVPDNESTAPNANCPAIVPVYPRWKILIGNEVVRRRESYTRYNREHEDIDGWGFVANDFSIQTAN